MSIEAINELFKSMDNNKALSDDFDKLDPQSDVLEQIVALGKKYNFDFTLEELKEVIAVARKINEAKKEEAQAEAAK